MYDKKKKRKKEKRKERERSFLDNYLRKRQKESHYLPSILSCHGHESITKTSRVE
jgi:hypothetical protein